MDRPLSLSFCKAPRVPWISPHAVFPTTYQLRLHHVVATTAECRRPPVAFCLVSRDLVFEVGIIIIKVQKSEGKYFDTVTCAFVRCSEECKKLQWRCETFRISILFQLAFSRDLFSLQLRVHHKPNVQREIGLNVHILTLFASFSQNCVSLLRLKLKWFCKFYKQSIRYKSLISMIKNTSNTAMNESLI